MLCSPFERVISEVLLPGMVPLTQELRNVGQPSSETDEELSLQSVRDAWLPMWMGLAWMLIHSFAGASETFE